MRHSIPSADFYWNYIQFVFSRQQLDPRFREIQLKSVTPNMSPATIAKLPALRIYQTWDLDQKAWSQAELEIPPFIKSTDTTYWLTLFPYAAAISQDFFNFWGSPKEWLINYQRKFQLHEPIAGIRTSYSLEMCNENRQVIINLQADPGWMFSFDDHNTSGLTLRATELPAVSINPGLSTPIEDE